MPHTEKLVWVEHNPETTWRDRLAGAWRSITLGPFNPKDKTIGHYFGSGEPASSGERVNEQKALSVSAFWSAATMLAADIGSLPLHLFKRLGDGSKQRYETHPLYRLLHDSPNADMSAMQFRESLMLSVLISGNAFAEIERDQAGRPIALHLLQPSAVTPFFDDQRQLRYRVPGIRGGDVILSAYDLLHLRGPSGDGIVGYSLIELAKDTLGLALASGKYAGRFFRNYSQIGGIVTTPNALPDLARENLKKALEARHQGADRAHGLLLLETGMTYTPTSVNPRDSQFAELREQQIREVARYFKIPPVMIGDLSRATWSNYEQAQSQYYQQAIRPWLVRLEAELNRTLVSSLERSTQFFEHSIEGYLRAAPQERANFYSALLDRGVMTINEVRRLENLAPVTGGDTPRVPMNNEPLKG